MFALLGSTYAWASPDFILDRLTYPQVRMYQDKARARLYLDSFGNAALMAQLGNVTGGRPAPGKEPDPDFEPFQPEDFLPWFARYEWPHLPARTEARAHLTPAAAREFFAAARDNLIPDWALQLADVRAWKNLADREA